MLCQVSSRSDLRNPILFFKLPYLSLYIEKVGSTLQHFADFIVLPLVFNLGTLALLS